MKLEEELKCNGLHGFGAGYAFGKANTPINQTLKGTDSYCAKGCSLSKECWARHRTKVQIMMPKAAQVFDALCDKLGQFKAMSAWAQAVKHVNARVEKLAKLPLTDPYLLQMQANLEDGYELAKTGKVKSRGEFTLRLPC